MDNGTQNLNFEQIRYLRQDPKEVYSGIQHVDDATDNDYEPLELEEPDGPRPIKFPF